MVVLCTIYTPVPTLKSGSLSRFMQVDAVGRRSCSLPAFCNRKNSMEFNAATVCLGSSDPQEKKKYPIYLHQKMKFTPFINYYDTGK